MARKRYTDEELLEIMREVYDKYGFISNCTINEYGKCSSSVVRSRFGSIDSAIEMLEIDLDKNLINAKKSRGNNISIGRKVYSENELLAKLKDYYDKFGHITTRALDKNKNYPNTYTYRKHFGTFENALRKADIPIDDRAMKFLNRKEYSKEELLEIFKYQVTKSISERGCLLTDDDIDNIKDMPSASCYYRKFKTIDNMYKEIGINRTEYNNKIIEDDMKQKYIEIKNILGRPPHSRDLDKFSRDNDKYYGVTTYLNHFGSMLNLHILMGDRPTNWANELSDNELLEKLIDLKNDLGIVPTQIDANICEYVPHSSVYRKRFGSFVNAIKMANMTPRSNKSPLITPKGNKALSGYEYKFMLMLEENGIEYDKEELYSKYIKYFERKYRFDFTIMYNETMYFIEIFGINFNDKYDKRAHEKIQLCKKNNLKLIDLYSEDFKGNLDDLYNLMISKIKQMEEGLHEQKD